MAPLFFKKAAEKLKGAKGKSPTDPSPAKTIDRGKVVVKSSLPSEVTEIPSEEPSSFPNSAATTYQTSLAPDGDELKSQASATKEDLWDLAYERLKNDEEKSRLIEKYECIILEVATDDSVAPSIAHDVSSPKGRERQMSKVVRDKFQAVQDARWKFVIFSKEIEVRKQFDRAVGAVTWAKDFITQAVSPDPHAALAWAGVCVLLPLLLNPSQQRDAAIKGLDTVSNLIRQSKVIDEIYFEITAETKTQALRDLTGDFKKKRVELYSQILEFEARLILYFSTNKVEQTLRDMIKDDSWDARIENIRKMGELSDSDRQIIDAERMKAGFEKFDRISKSIENELSGLRRRWEDRDRRDILGWLSPIDSRTRQIDTLSIRQEGTGKWLFEEPAFEHWVCGAERILWCFGIPGAGKTILASTVIDYLEHRFCKDDVAIAYLYCNYKEQENQTPQTLIGSLVQQLVQRNTAIPDDLKDFHEKHARYPSPTPPTLDECLRLLKSQLACCPSAFLVIDALDECKDETREKLCAQLRKLQGNTHILITSRDIPELRVQINPSAQLEIRASDDDIVRYTKDRIESGKRLEELTEDLNLRDLVINTISENTKGMFLLAQLHLDSLALELTPNEVRKALKSLPTSLPMKYDEIMDRIDSQDVRAARLAKKVLSWLSYAKRPLTVAEMQHAVKVESTTTRLDEGDMTSQEILVSVCAGIVTVDEKSKIIRLVHYSVAEYFLQTRSRHFQDAEREIATACLTYLSFSDFEAGYCETDEALESLLEKNALLDYASRNWADHARNVTESESVMGAALNFLKNPPKTSLSFQVMEIWSSRYGYSQMPARCVSGLHLCVLFRMHSMIIRMLGTQSKVNVTDSRGQTPLWLAVKTGNEAAVQLLLDNGAEVDTEDNKGGQTPLWLAAGKGQEAIAQLLLDNGAKVDVKDNDNGRTPLSIAAEKGHEAVVRILLDSGAEVDARGSYYGRETPLWWAAREGHETVVQLLLDNGAEVDAKGISGGWTPLWQAVDKGHEAVVQLLLNNGAEVDAEDKVNNETPLSRAAEHGHEAIVQMLLDEGAEVNVKSSFEMTPLSRAAKRGHETIVQLLLDNGAGVDTKNTPDQTPLWVAVEEGHEVVIRLLLNKGAEVNITDKYGRTPLLLAVEKGHEAIVPLLLNSGAEIDVKNSESWTPLWQAIRKRHEAVVRILLDKGAEVDAKDKDGQTPLLWAANEGHEAVVQFLLDKGAEVDAKDKNSRTPLLAATEKWHEAVVRILLDKGAEVDARDKDGRTPLLLASSRGCEPAVCILLDKGAMINVKDENGHTPLSRATKGGHEAVMRILLDNRAEVNTKDEFGRTLLWYAAYEGNEVVLQLLLDKGAEANAMGDDGTTPLSMAAWRGYEAVVRLLLDKSAEIDAKDIKYNGTPLWWAVMAGREAIVQLLLDKGADINAKDHENRTPLSRAVERGHEAVARLLLDKGAETDAKDENSSSL